MNKKLDFFELVYDVVSKIPTGRVSTYGAIASFLGTKNSARVVGWAMNASHMKGNIPAVGALHPGNKNNLTPESYNDGNQGNSNPASPAVA